MKLHTPKTGTLQAATTLTATYATAGGVNASQGRDQLYLLVNYTIGDETDMRIKVQFSDTSTFTTAYEETAGSTSAAGVTTVSAREYKLTATGKYMIPIQTSGMYWRAQVKATAGTPTGTVAVDYRMDVVQK